MVTTTYLLGLATLPAIAGLVLAIWGVCRLLDRLGATVINRLKPRQPRQRATAGAIVACARTVTFVRLPFDSALILAVGHEMSKGDEIADAIHNVIDPRTAPTVRLTPSGGSR